MLAYRTTMTPEIIESLEKLASDFNISRDALPLLEYYGLYSRDDVRRFFAGAFKAGGKVRPYELQAFIKNSDVYLSGNKCFLVASWQYRDENLTKPRIKSTFDISEAFSHPAFTTCLDKYGSGYIDFDDVVPHYLKTSANQWTTNKIIEEYSTAEIVSHLLNSKLDNATWWLTETMANKFFDVFPECLADDDEEESDSE